MTLDLSRARIQLSGRRPLTLTDARGTRLRAVDGTSWVTIDHDRRDWVLEPGDELVVDSAARVMLTSLGRDATIDLSAGTPRPAAPRRALAWLAQAWPGGTRAAATSAAVA